MHAELFPDPLEAEEDTALLARWERLMKIREEVYKALEIARADKRIGTGLEARVVLEAPEETREFLRTFGDSLRFLFITSEVELGPVGDGAFRSESASDLAVEVRRAEGEKCQRCWNYTTDVGADADWPGICARCSGHVREIVSEAERA